MEDPRGPEGSELHHQFSHICAQLTLLQQSVDNLHQKVDKVQAAVQIDNLSSALGLLDPTVHQGFTSDSIHESEEDSPVWCFVGTNVDLVPKAVQPKRPYLQVQADISQDEITKPLSRCDSQNCSVSSMGDMEEMVTESIRDKNLTRSTLGTDHVPELLDRDLSDIEDNERYNQRQPFSVDLSEQKICERVPGAIPIQKGLEVHAEIFDATDRSEMGDKVVDETEGKPYTQEVDDQNASGGDLTKVSPPEPTVHAPSPRHSYERLPSTPQQTSLKRKRVDTEQDNRSAYFLTMEMNHLQAYSQTDIVGNATDNAGELHSRPNIAKDAKLSITSVNSTTSETGPKAPETDRSVKKQSEDDPVSFDEDQPSTMQQSGPVTLVSIDSRTGESVTMPRAPYEPGADIEQEITPNSITSVDGREPGSRNGEPLRNNQQVSPAGFKNMQSRRVDNRFDREAHAASMVSTGDQWESSPTNAYLINKETVPPGWINDDQIQTVIQRHQTEAKNCCVTKSPNGIDTIICLDASSSMAGEPLHQAKEIVLNFLDGLENNAVEHELEENVAIVTFGAENKIMQHLTNNFDDLREAIENIEARGVSNLWMGFALALTEISVRGESMEMSHSILMPRIIIISDGFCTRKNLLAGDDIIEVNTDAMKEVQQLVSNNARHVISNMDCITVGPHNKAFLTALSSGRMFNQHDVTYLAEFFRTQVVGNSLVSECVGTSFSEEEIREKLEAQDLDTQSMEDIRKMLASKIECDLEDKKRMAEANKQMSNKQLEGQSNSNDLRNTNSVSNINTSRSSSDNSRSSNNSSDSSELNSSQRNSTSSGNNKINSTPNIISGDNNNNNNNNSSSSGNNKSNSSHNSSSANSSSSNSAYNESNSSHYSGNANSSSSSAYNERNSSHNSDNANSSSSNSNGSSSSSSLYSSSGNNSRKNGNKINSSDSLDQPEKSTSLEQATDAEVKAKQQCGEDMKADSPVAQSDLQDRGTADGDDYGDMDEFEFGTHVRSLPEWDGHKIHQFDVGTIIGHRKEGMVDVIWSDGARGNVRCGVNGQFDIQPMPASQWSNDVVRIGAVVRRGPHWRWGDQDGGAGNKGVVIKVDEKRKSIYVTWTHESSGNYRHGYDNKYDVELCPDSSPVPEVTKSHVVWHIQLQEDQWEPLPLEVGQVLEEQSQTGNQRGSFLVSVGKNNFRISLAAKQARNTDTQDIFPISRMELSPEEWMSLTGQQENEL